MNDFLLRLRPKKSISAIHALRRGLKYLLRSCGLRAVSVEEIPERSGLRAGALPPASQRVKDTNSNEH
jgi:hypothetical protein